MYAVGSTWDSGETITAKNTAGTVIGTLKGGWYGLFDGLSATTNDNLYFHPTATVFFSRSQRWGTDKWVSQPAITAPTLTIDAWRTAHLSNTNNTFSNKTVDNRSALIVGAYDTRKPLVSILADSVKLSENTPATTAFTVHRVSAFGYASPLTVSYSIRRNAGDAESGVDFEPLSGTLTIPAGERSAKISIKPKLDSQVEPSEAIALLLKTDDNNYVVANSLATLSLTDATITSLDSFAASADLKMTIYPNPLNSDEVLFSLTGFDKNESIVLFINDLSGREMYRTTVQAASQPESRLSIQRNLFSSGTYIVKAVNKKGVVLIQKLVVR